MKNYGIDLAVDPHVATGMVRRLVANKGLKVVFNLDEGSMPYTDGKTIHIDPPSPMWTKHSLRQWWGKVAHETKHSGFDRGQSVFPVMKEHQCDCLNDLRDGMFNFFEDSVVDNLGRGEFLGVDESADWARYSIARREFEHPDMGKTIWYAEEPTEEALFVGVSNLLANEARGTWQTPMKNIASDFMDSDVNPNGPINIELVTRYNQVVHDGFLDKLIEYQNDPEGHTAEDIYKFTYDVSEYFDLPEPPPKNTDSDGADSGTSSGESSETESETEAGEQPTQAEAEARKVLFESIRREDMHLEERQDFSSASGPIKIEYEKSDIHYEPVKTRKFLVVDHPKKQVRDAAGDKKHVKFDNFTREDAYFTNEIKEAIVKHKDTLATEVKKHIQAETRTKRARNKKRGKLDRGRLYKLGVKDAPQDWQEKVFKKITRNLSVEQTAVSLLVDCSGSMCGTPFVNAVLSMDVIGDVCNTLNLDYEMAGFTTYGSSDTPVHLVFKPFGVKVNRQDIVTYMTYAAYILRNNADGENILVAYRRLMDRRKAKRRVLLVLSDGQPASYGGDIYGYTKEVIAGIEKEGQVEIHGIGLEDDSVSRLYKSHSVLDDVGQLEQALLAVLKNTVLKIS